MDIYLSIAHFFDLYFLARTWSAAQRGQSRPFVIVSYHESARHTPMFTLKCDIAKASGGEILSIQQAKEQIIADPEHRIYIHSYGSIDQSVSLATTFGGLEWIAYADAYKNEIQSNFLTQYCVQSALFFGWVMMDSISRDYLQKVEYICFSDIDAFHAMLRSRLQTSPLAFEQDALILIARYWGIGAYKFRPEANLGNATISLLEQSELHHHTTIVIKEDMRIPEVQRQALYDALASHYDTIIPLHEYLPHLAEMVHFIPFEVLCDGEFSSDTYFYDSSVCIPLACLTRAKLHFVMTERLEEWFDSQSHGTNTIIRYSNLYRKAATTIHDRNAIDDDTILLINQMTIDGEIVSLDQLNDLLIKNNADPNAHQQPRYQAAAHIAVGIGLDDDELLIFS